MKERAEHESGLVAKAFDDYTAYLMGRRLIVKADCSCVAFYDRVHEVVSYARSFTIEKLRTVAITCLIRADQWI